MHCSLGQWQNRELQKVDQQILLFKAYFEHMSLSHNLIFLISFSISKFGQTHSKICFQKSTWNSFMRCWWSEVADTLSQTWRNVVSKNYRLRLSFMILTLTLTLIHFVQHRCLSSAAAVMCLIPSWVPRFSLGKFVTIPCLPCCAGSIYCEIIQRAVLGLLWYPVVTYTCYMTQSTESPPIHEVYFRQMSISRITFIKQEGKGYKIAIKLVVT